MLASPCAAEVVVPSPARRWIEESRVWVQDKQSKGRWMGRNGGDALRFLRLCGELLDVPPNQVREPHLWELVGHMGTAPKTRRTYLALLGSFLSSRGNWVVQESGIRREFPNRTSRTPVITGEDRDRILNAAVGTERVALSFLALGRRPIEIIRLRVTDVHLDRSSPSYDVRQKGGHGEVTDRDVPLAWAARELLWWLPLRTRWSQDSTEDSGHLVCRQDGARLLGVSKQYLDRMLHAVEARAGVAKWPAYSFRRGALTMLRERGADWDDVSGAALHSSPETTRIYVDPMVRRRRLEGALRLIEPRQGGNR